MSNETTATFAVELKDRVSTGARSATDALSDLRQTILGGTSQLREIQAAMNRLRAGGMAGSQAFRDLRNRADALKASVGASQEAFIRLGGDLSTLKSSTPTAALDELLGTMADLPGPLGRGASQLSALASSGPLAALGIAGLVAIAVQAVAAMVSLVAAVAQATAALVQYGLAAASARRDEMLHLEGVVSMRSWYSRAAGSASELQSSIDRVASSSAVSRTRVAGYAEQLYRAGLRGAALEDALRGVSTVAAVQGDRMADRFRGMAVAAARTGGSVRALSDDVDRRLGGTARRMALSWDRQMERLRESWSSLFAGIRLDGALESLDRVLSLFSQSTASGRALRTLMQAFFQPLLDSISTVDGPVTEFFEGALITTLELAIAVLHARNVIRSWTTSFAGLGAGVVNWGELGRQAVLVFVSAVGGSLVVLGLLFALIAGAALVVLSPLIAAGVLAATIGIAIGAVIASVGQWMGETASWMSGLDWEGLGRSLIDGLVSGIAGGAQRAWATVTSLGDGMTAALRAALDIHSPSRVFADLGRQIPRGLAVGIEAEQGTAATAIEGIAALPAATAGRASGSTVHVSIDRIEITTAAGSSSPSDIASRIREELERALADVLAETGAAHV